VAATLLAMARPLASPLSARPGIVHRRVPLRGRGNRLRKHPGRPGGWRTRRCLGARAGRCGCPRCRRPWSRRCWTASHLERWDQASVRVAGSVLHVRLKDHGLAFLHSVRLKGHFGTPAQATLDQARPGSHR